MVQNNGYFKGKTVVITGASRGIGLEIALKLARDGANIVIAAKTTEPHPKLPGTIYTAADAVRAAGGRALACVVDVRDEQAVEKCVEETVRTFGGIDILINNASAISLTGTVDTPMKRYDLMHNINTRGTFLMSQKCLPHLLKSKCGHILNNSPPLEMKPEWFGNHVAYTMAKFGMSMCVLGMAEEFKGQVAVNAIWPRTPIWTAATQFLGTGDEESKSICRSPAIMADAAYYILSQNVHFSGNLLIDEQALNMAGVKNMDKYSYKKDAQLAVDIFVPEKWNFDHNVRLSKL